MKKKPSNSEKNNEATLNKEIDIDANGNEIVVDRVRNSPKTNQSLPNKPGLENPNSNRGVHTDKEAMKTVENEDKNSDITAHRYPNASPENHTDRGNGSTDQ